MQEIQLAPKSVEIGKQTVSHIVTQEDIRKILHWYKDEYFLVREVVYRERELTAYIKFSDYPFVRGEMPFVSSNLINLAIDQIALIHIGMMIKCSYIKLVIVKDNRVQGHMSFDEYNRIVGDEFVTAKIEGKYLKPIPPMEEIQVIGSFLDLKKSATGRYIFEFLFQSKQFFNIKAIFVYPLTLKLVGR